MSYQIHYDNGNKQKNIIISRKQSYHGLLYALSAGDRPNLYFYKNILNKNVQKLKNTIMYGTKNETMIDYANRSAKDFEKKILKIGPEKFVVLLRKLWRAV